MTVPILAIVSCAMLASPNPSALQGIVWDGGAIASREKSERSSWDSMKSKAEGFAMGRWILKQTERHRLVQSMYDGQFKTVTLWSRGPNKKRWVEEAIRDYTSHSEEHGDRLMSSNDVRKRLEMSLGDHFNIAAGSAVLLMVPSLLAFLTSYNTPRKGISCHSGTYLIYAITQVVECLFWGWEVWLKGLYGERWSEARTRAKTINWCGQMLAGLLAILTAVAGTFLQLLGVYRTCACKVILCSLFLPRSPGRPGPLMRVGQVPLRYWLRPEAPEAYVDLGVERDAEMEDAKRWWIAAGIAAVGLVCAACAFAWYHQRRLRQIFRVEADRLDEGRIAPQLTLEESYETMTKGMEAHRDHVGGYIQRTFET